MNYIFETLAKRAARLSRFNSRNRSKGNRSKEKRNLIISLTKSKQKQRYGSNIPGNPELLHLITLITKE